MNMLCATVEFRMKYPIVSALPLALLLTGCADLPTYTDPSTDPKQRPMAFHDTRLQYALVTGEDQTLVENFDMKLPPSMAERIVAGVALPFTAALETIYWPVSTGIKALAPVADYPKSAK